MSEEAKSTVVVTPVSNAPVAAVEPTKPAEVAAEPAAADAPAQEAAPTEGEDKKKPRGISKYLATVKEREARAAQKEAELAEKERILNEKEQSGTNEIKVTAEDLKLRPSEFLKKHGITFEEFAKAVINEGNGPTTEDELNSTKERLLKLEQDREDEKKKKQEEEDKRQQDYIDKAVNDYKALLKQEIESKPDDYELIIANQAHALVFDVVEAYYLKNQKILDMKVACEHVENYLLERAKKLLTAKKLSAGKVEEKTEPAKKMVTLTNSVGSHSAPSANGIPATLSREERLKLASQKLVYN